MGTYPINPNGTVGKCTRYGAIMCAKPCVREPSSVYIRIHRFQPGAGSSHKTDMKMVAGIRSRYVRAPFMGTKSIQLLSKALEEQRHRAASARMLSSISSSCSSKSFSARKAAWLGPGYSRSCWVMLGPFRGRQRQCPLSGSM